MKASVIIPVYNGEAHIRKCIESLLEQTHKELEIIIIDDGSTDGTLGVCRSFSDERITIITQENQGVSAARNRGVEYSTGSILFFVDADDWVENRFIEKLIAPFSDSSISLVACGYLLDDSKTSKTSRFNRNYIGKVNKVVLAEAVLKPSGIEGYMCNKAFRRCLILENNLMVDEKITICEDVKFVMDFINHSEFGEIIEDCLYHYVQHESSAKNQSIRGQLFNPKWLSEIKAWQDILELPFANNELREIIRGRLGLASTLYLKRMIRCEYQNDEVNRELLYICRKNIRYAFKYGLGTKKWLLSAAICSISPKLAARF